MQQVAVIALLLPGLLFLCAIVSMLAVHRRDLARVHYSGTCARCDYDLTGNKSGVCPECGERIKQNRAAESNKITSTRRFE